ncbi:MAG: tyrosine-protein phosphatase [Clostridia bacterium]|nr:tyrosine-protein phosphatase [Clostridia bacterium]
MRKTRKTMIISLCLAVLLLICTPALLSAEAVRVPDDELMNIPVYHEPELGGVFIDVSADRFLELGFAYGDSVNIAFSNGYSLEDVPYFNGYYVRPGDILVTGTFGLRYLKVCINYGEDVWTRANLSEGDTADISMCEKAKYLNIQNIASVELVNDRSAFSSDEVFANFRSLKGGNLKEDYLYRSASPCDNVYNRAHYAAKLMTDAGVRFILNLEDGEEKINQYKEKDDFDSPGFQALYEEGKVALAPITTNYTSEEFRSGLIDGLRALAHSDGPYLIHCMAGRDRTGFACMLLEALAGSSCDEIIDDYMITYQNYYGVTKEGDPETYGLIRDINIIPMISFMAGVTEEAVQTVDYAASAERYLKEGGMSEEDIRLLKAAILK